MRAVPPLRVKVERFQAWNALLIGLGVLVVLVAGLWFVSDRDQLPAWSAWLVGGLTVVSVLGLGITLRHSAVVLRWDSEHWYSLAPAVSDHEDGPWQVRVPFDLGGFMLLRLEAQGDRNPMSSRWLPVQRSGLPAEWHSLRCAVHSGRVGGISSTNPSLADSN